MPEAQTLQAAARHGVQHCLTSVRRLERVNSFDVHKHEREVEDAELVGEGFELRQRRCCELNVTLKHCFEDLVIVVKGRVRVNFDAHRAVHLSVYTRLEQACSDPLGVLVGVGNVREFDDDLAFVTAHRVSVSSVCSNSQSSGRYREFHEFHLFLPKDIRAPH